MTTTEQKIALNIDDTYRVCNPERPLTADDTRYVNLTKSRGMNHISKTIARRIRRSDEFSQVKLLLTGHRGSGKTTELLRLRKELGKNNYFTVYMDVAELLDLGSLNYLDVLVAIAQQIQVQLAGHDMPLSAKLLDNIANWFAEHIVEEKKQVNHAGSLKTEAKGGVEIPFVGKLFARVTADIKAASSRRDTIRHNLRREIRVFMEKLNVLIGSARQIVQDKGATDLVLIVDGIEKMHYEVNKDGQSTHSELFVQHAEQLRSPQCHIIYTVPVSLAYNQNLGADFDSIFVLPMVKTDAAGVKLLIEIIQKRVNTEQVFADQSLLKILAKNSGGVVRDLMRLVQMSTDTDGEKITETDVIYAINTLKKEYDRLIRSSDIDRFRQIKAEKHIQGGDETSARLLNLRLVLEYQNGKGWADLHPIIYQIPWVKKALDGE